MRELRNIMKTVFRNIAAVGAAVLLMSVSPSGEITDIVAAKEWCDKAPLSLPEGIWDYPEDNARVLVKRADGSPNITYDRYDVIVIETPDCRLRPGQAIGELSASADRNIYTLKLFTSIKNGIPAIPETCMARLDSRATSFSIFHKKLSVKFRANRLLPNFWKMISISVKDPADNIPHGMIKVYPTPDGNSSPSTTPHYL